MLTGKQIAALAELLHTCRPEWDTRGIQAALRRVDDAWAWPAVCIHAITVTSNPANQTPETIAWDRHSTVISPPCPDHGGRARRADGTYGCCWADQYDPQPYRRTGVSTPPAGMRERIRAQIERRRPFATPENATSGPVDGGNP